MIDRIHNFPRIAVYIILSIITLIFIIYSFYTLQNKKAALKPHSAVNIKVGDKEKVKYPVDYTIVMLGDSMTETLGNSTELKQYLANYYKGKTFEVLNYGFGATNILSAMDRITKETEHGRKFRAIDEIDYNLILIESFGENPLSQFPLDEGLRHQNEELDKIVNKLKETNPKGIIVFVATISPNKVIFAQNQVDLSPEKREEWVIERVAYIKNHIAYAKAHNIPVIDIFDKSLVDIHG